MFRFDTTQPSGSILLISSVQVSVDAYPERVAESRLTVVPCLHASVVCGLYFVTCVDFVFTVVCSARCGSIQKVLQIFSYFQSCLAGPFTLFLLLLEQSSVRIGRKYC